MLAIGLGLGVTITPSQEDGGSPAPASAITLLKVVDATGLDATGDYGDVTSRPGVNGSGFVGMAVLPWLAGQTFDPTKISLTVSDPGYNGAGSTTVNRTVTGGEILRRQYSAQAQRQQANDGVTLTVYFSLSEEVYQGSTITAAAAAAGYYGASQAGAINTRVNASTRAYPKALWAWLNLPQERATGSGFNVEGVAYHRHAMNGRQVARVEFIAKDSQGTPNVAATQTASSTSLSAFQTKGQIAEAYKAAIPLANLTQGDLCQVNVKVYPWIGDASSVLDLAVDGVAWPTANPQTPLRFLNDKTGGYGGAHAAVKAGAAGGTVQSSYAAAVGTPYPTINAALAAVQVWNNANKGHNDHSGATVWLMEDSAGAGANHSTANSGVAANINTVAAGQCWTDVRVDTAATGTVKMTMAATRTATSLIRWMVDIDHTAGNGLDMGATVNYSLAAFEGKLNLAGTTATVPVCYRTGLVYLRNFEVVGAPTAVGPIPGGVAGAAFRMQFPLQLGCVMEDIAINKQLLPFGMIGCKTKRCTLFENDNSAIPNFDSNDGMVIANNLFRDARLASEIGRYKTYSRGLAFIQNVIERSVAASSIPALQIGGDDRLLALDNVVITYNTIPGVDTGSRANLAYADAVGSEGVIKRISLRFNLLYEYNCKTDTFTTKTTSTGRVGNWQGRYGVGFEGNAIVNGDSSGAGVVDASGGNWLGEFWPTGNGLKVGASNVTFTDNKAGTAGAGGGTYTLTGGSNAAYSRVVAGRAGLAFDLAGASRRNDGSGAAGAYERTV